MSGAARTDAAPAPPAPPAPAAPAPAPLPPWQRLPAGMRVHLPTPPRLAALLWALALALVAHALALHHLRQALRPPSLLREVAPTFYTRTLTPEAPPPVVALAPAAEAAAPARPSAVLRPATPPVQAASAPKPRASAPKRRRPRPPAKPPAPPETLAQATPDAAAAPDLPPPTPELPAPPPEPPADLPPENRPEETPEGTPEGTPEATSEASPETAPEIAANPTPEPPPDLPPNDTPTEAPPAPPAGNDPDAPHLASWPPDTRLRYTLTGHYRGPLHGHAQVLWQREGTQYQAVVQLDVGLLLSSRFTSQGRITPQGLHPEVYEEQVRQRRRGVRLHPDSVQLQNGERAPRPADVQDTASQFVELGHRFATGQLRLTPGGQIDFWLARPNRVDAWTYDVLSEDTLYLPRLGPVQAFHLKPRPLNRPSGSVSAEIWFAPSLQYLPVRIRLSQGEDTHMDLLLDVVDQKAPTP